MADIKSEKYRSVRQLVSEAEGVDATEQNGELYVKKFDPATAQLPKVTVNVRFVVQAYLLDLGVKEELELYNTILTKVALHQGFLSFEEHKYDEQTKAWRVLLRICWRYSIFEELKS